MCCMDDAPILAVELVNLSALIFRLEMYILRVCVYLTYGIPWYLPTSRSSPGRMGDLTVVGYIVTSIINTNISL